MDGTVLISGDSHCLEPEDLWTTGLPRPEWRERAPRMRRIDGMKQLEVNGHSLERSYDYRRYAPPGTIDDDGGWHEAPTSAPHQLIDYDQDVETRLRDLDRDGVWAETIHPNAGGYVY